MGLDRDFFFGIFSMELIQSMDYQAWILLALLLESWTIRGNFHGIKMYVYRRWIMDSCNGKIDPNFSFAFLNDPRNFLYD